MSGGYFDYQQYNIGEIAKSIQKLVDQETNPKEGEFTYGFSEKTLGRFRNAIVFLKLGRIYVQRIDWLVSGDDSEETFHELLKNDLSTIGFIHREQDLEYPGKKL